MPKDDVTIYDKRELYEEKIEKLVKELTLACTIAELPMFVSVAVANDENGTEYQSEAVLSSTKATLTSPGLGTILLRLHGLDTDYPDHINQSIRDLQQYLAKIERTNYSVCNHDVVLKDDKIEEMNEIVSGDKKAKIPKKDQTGDFLKKLQESRH